MSLSHRGGRGNCSYFPRSFMGTGISARPARPLAAGEGRKRGCPGGRERGRSRLHFGKCPRRDAPVWRVVAQTRSQGAEGASGGCGNRRRPKAPDGFYFARGLRGLLRLDVDAAASPVGSQGREAPECPMDRASRLPALRGSNDCPRPAGPRLARTERPFALSGVLRHRGCLAPGRRSHRLRSALRGRGAPA